MRGRHQFVGLLLRQLRQRNFQRNGNLKAFLVRAGANPNLCFHHNLAGTYLFLASSILQRTAKAGRISGGKELLGICARPTLSPHPRRNRKRYVQIAIIAACVAAARPARCHMGGVERVLNHSRVPPFAILSLLFAIVQRCGVLHSV